MPVLALRGARIFTGERFVEDQDALVADGRVLRLVPSSETPPGAQIVHLAGGILAPGFVDVQVNGGGGVLVDGSIDENGLRRMAAAHGRHGTTTLLPTLITDRPEATAKVLAILASVMAVGLPGVGGLHLEGPFLSLARKGAHDPALIRPMTEADLVAIRDAVVRPLLLTVAPENVTIDQIRRLADAGVLVSLGHTDTSYETAMAAADAGARGVTHLFNAMSPLQHRAPGVVGAALDHGGLWTWIIPDGYHVHPGALRAAIAAKRGPGRLFLTTDAMPTAADPADVFELNGRRVVRRDGRLTLDDGTLAGSDLTMDVALRYAIAHLGLSIEEGLRMASLYPAQFLGLDQRIGRVAPGYRADLVHLDDSLAVRAVWIGGEQIDRQNRS